MKRRRAKRKGPLQWVVSFNRYNRAGPIVAECVVEADGRFAAIKAANEQFPLHAKDGQTVAHARLCR